MNEDRSARSPGRSPRRAMATGAAMVCLLVSGALWLGTAPAMAAGGWHQVFPATVPPARTAPAMARDPVRQDVVLFGGFGGDRYLNDTWLWDGSTWTLANTPVAPPARAAGAMAWDARAGVLVLYGGFNGHHYLGDTWTWGGPSVGWKAWPRPASAPPAVTAPMLFTDPLTGHADVYGGFDGQFYQLQTWQWDGSEWQQLHPQHVATARSAAVAALDASRHQVVMYGGLGDVNPLNTWIWDGRDWTEVFPAHQPDFVYDAGSAYDVRAKQVTAFGGANGGTPLGETWSWNGTDWVKAMVLAHPPARESMGMAFDPITRQLLVFAGQDRNEIDGDTWEG
jgi:Galactose oxidase, central domain